MKKIYTIIFLLINLTSFSQLEKDAGEIIGIVVNDYKVDTIEVFYKFNNDELISDLVHKEMRSMDYDKIFSDCSKKFDSITERKKFDECIVNEISNDTMTFEFKKMRIPFFSKNMDILKKTNKKKVTGFYKGKYQKDKKVKPIVFISYPLFDKYKEKAIVYCSYVVTGLSGNMGYYILEKIDGKWKISSYEVKGFF